jgi:hypothetical protein
MSIAYERISLHDLSHDPSPYLAEIGCMSSTQTQKNEICTKTCLEIEKEIPEWCENDHFSKIRGLPSRLIVPSIAARVSGVFASVQAPGGKSGIY